MAINRYNTTTIINNNTSLTKSQNPTLHLQRPGGFVLIDSTLSLENTTLRSLRGWQSGVAWCENAQITLDSDTLSQLRVSFYYFFEMCNINICFFLFRTILVLLFLMVNQKVEPLPMFL
jgi:hypothetical protein